MTVEIKKTPRCSCGGKPLHQRATAGWFIECGKCGYKTATHEDNKKTDKEWEDMATLTSLTITPKSVWLEHRARELADYICKLLDVPMPNTEQALKTSMELWDVLEDVVKEHSKRKEDK